MAPRADCGIIVGMRASRRHEQRRELMARVLACGWGLAGISLASTGCATRDATSSVLTTAGAAAVIVGATMAADTHCYQSSHSAGGAYCSPGLSKSTRNAGTALAIAGVGAAAVGYALQPRGPDQLGPAPSPRAPTRPYRLLRRPVEPEPGGSAPAGAATAGGAAATSPETAVAPAPESAAPEPGAVAPRVEPAPPPAPAPPQE